MHVILIQNVPKLGQVGDVCQVAPGYGRNYLIPQGLAILATAGARKQIDDLKRTEHRRQDKIRAEMEDFARRIGRLHLSFNARVGETGRLYGSITAADIAEAVEAALSEPFDRRKIVLDESIRTLGDHLVAVHLMPGVDAEVRVTVVAEGEAAEEALKPPDALEATEEALKPPDVLEATDAASTAPPAPADEPAAGEAET